MATVKVRTQRRKGVTRRAIKMASNGRARLHVHRSGKHIYAQVIDDVKGEIEQKIGPELAQKQIEAIKSKATITFDQAYFGK